MNMLRSIVMVLFSAALLRAQAQVAHEPALPASWKEHLTALEYIRSRSANEQVFLKKLFSYVHRHLLREFTEEVSFDQTISTGNYNCLTATTTFALLLRHFGISHEVVETTYHIFILARLNGKVWLMETTDAGRGLIRGEKVVFRQMENYRHFVPAQGKEHVYVFRKNIFNTTSITGLRGLDFYNQAVYAYNRRDIKKSVYLLQQAAVYYHSPRIQELAGLLWISVQESQLNELLKNELTRRLAIVRNISAPLLASSAP
jgi:hypothetical protein